MKGMRVRRWRILLETFHFETSPTKLTEPLIIQTAKNKEIKQKILDQSLLVNSFSMAREGKRKGFLTSFLGWKINNFGQFVIENWSFSKIQRKTRSSLKVHSPGLFSVKSFQRTPVKTKEVMSQHKI